MEPLIAYTYKNDIDSLKSNRFRQVKPSDFNVDYFYANEIFLNGLAK